ncbi:glycosyl transferase [Bacteroidia bacterium]|nr:glycosyl transferase [Bacteroidia bacterium]
MKVLILDTTEFGQAPNRILKALQKNGIDAKMLVRSKYTDDKSVSSLNTSWLTTKNNFLRFAYERLVIFLHNHFNRLDLFKVSIANTGTNIVNHPLVREADILHLHWINQGFLSLKDLNALIDTGKPIVWTMHDMWAFTGICHHSWGCERFTEECGFCPFLHSDRQKDLSYRIFKSKKIIKGSGIHLVAVSSWLKLMALKSANASNLKVSVIPNVIDINTFHPLDKTSAREKLSLSVDKKIVIMGALRINDPVKGFVFLKEAMQKVYSQRQDVVLVLFGSIKGQYLLSDISFPVLQMGLMKDVSQIVELYAAADVNVVPSYYETFGQTITESMACGCPSVSFNNSGQTDIIDHKINGYLAEYRDSEDLANGIVWVLDNTERLHLPEACIEKVQTNYTESVVAEKYISLYKELLTKQ